MKNTGQLAEYASQALIKSDNIPTISGIEKTLTRVEKEIIDDTSPRCCDMDSNEINVLAFKIISKCNVATGLKFQGDEATSTIKELIFNILQKSSLTMKDISIATELGLAGEFLDEGSTTVFFTPSQFSIWLKKYAEKIKREAMRKKVIINEKKEVKDAPSEDKVIEQNFETINMVIKLAASYGNVNEFYGSPTLQISGEFLFLFLEKMGIIKLSADYKNKIYDTFKKANKKDLVRQCRIYCMADWAYGMNKMEFKLNKNGEKI